MLKNWLEKGKQVIQDNAQEAWENIQNRLNKTYQEWINGTPVFASIQKADNSECKDWDEKHYFVVPFHLSESKFALHSIRYLPKGVKEVNDLPKRRVFHFPDPHSEYSLQHYMTEMAQNKAAQSTEKSSLESLADDIDALDKKLTYGMLLVGGLAAIVNPLLGAGLALKALLPGIPSLLNKYGLKPLGEKVSENQLKQAVIEAQDQVADAFSNGTTIKVVNPILQQLDIALNTTEDEYNPLTGVYFSSASLSELEGDYWRDLTEDAMFEVYKELLETPELYKKASLGVEDLNWLKVMFAGKQVRG